MNISIVEITYNVAYYQTSLLLKYYTISFKATCKLLNPERVYYPGSWFMDQTSFRKFSLRKHITSAKDMLALATKPCSANQHI